MMNDKQYTNTNEDNAYEKTKDVIIIGGGWAGLSCAYLLAKKGLSVGLLEASTLGGRARAIPKPFAGLPIDNGQHLLVGAYHSLLGLVKQLDNDRNVKRHSKLKPRRIPHERFYYYSVSSLYPKGKKLSFLNVDMMKLVWKLTPYVFGIKKTEDCPFLDFCQKLKLPSDLIENILGPIVHAALSTSIEKASTHVTLTVLKEVFNPIKPGNSNLIILQEDLSEFFVEPIRQWAKLHSSEFSKGSSSIEISENNRVKRIFQNPDKTFNIHASKGEFCTQKVILATPFYVTAQLLADMPILNGLKEKLDKLEHEQIGTIYIAYEAKGNDNHVALFRNKKMVHVIGQAFEYLFYRKIETPTMSYHLFSAVILKNHNNNISSMKESIKQWIEKYCALESSTCQYAKAIIEKKASFSCTPQSNHYRTDIKTSVDGLYIIGDHVNTGLPGTLEGAVRSAVMCAQMVF